MHQKKRSGRQAGEASHRTIQCGQEVNPWRCEVQCEPRCQEPVGRAQDQEDQLRHFRKLWTPGNRGDAEGKVHLVGHEDSRQRKGNHQEESPHRLSEGEAIQGGTEEG